MIGLRGFIDQFWQNKFPPKSRYDVQTRLRALLEPAINPSNISLSISFETNMQRK